MTQAHRAFWPRGVPWEVTVPRVPLTHYVETAAARYPDKAVVRFAGATLTYAQLWQRVQALAGYLQQRLGVQPGDRVLLVSQNCPQFLVAVYGIQRAGAAVVPVNPMSTEPELRYYAQDSGATVVICAQELLGPVQACMASGEIRQAVVLAYGDAFKGVAAGDIDGDLPAVVTAPRAPLPEGAFHGFEAAIAEGLLPGPGHPSVDDLAVLPYTSGTTGHPKGCRHSHGTVLASNLASQVWRGFHMDTVFLCVAPLFHMLGFQNGMNMPITLGATLVMMPRWNPAQAVALVERYRVTAWTAPPAMVIDFFAQPAAQTADLSSLALLSGGGAAMPEAVATMLAERFGLHYNEAYGLTETAAFLHANPRERGKRQCLGVPTQGVDSRIVDPETLRELPQGEVGELVTRGPQVMLGYWRNPQADAAAFIELDGQRFFRTGDLASVDEDGYFFMRDRLKRMINASGFKVWPAEIESMLYEHPAVQEACVVGVPDAKRGETVRALVVRKPGAELTEDALLAWCRERMAAYKAPRSVKFMVNLLRSGTGKVAWRELQAAEAAATASETTETR
ncbi:long-chain-fatty-acid--CoA ligase [Ramlibacter sp.]|uniref:long-chain-fatty-acid--CoA ligase n=1 Tax=Ramlibacter sp. TaxID=1917967 RepID=UPI0035AF7D0F